ncbi:MAG: hypothetical protein QM756_20485 [Polyangiaceae bacterium]
MKSASYQWVASGLGVFASCLSLACSAGTTAGGQGGSSNGNGGASTAQGGATTASGGASNGNGGAQQSGGASSGGSSNGGASSGGSGTSGSASGGANSGGGSSNGGSSSGGSSNGGSTSGGSAGTSSGGSGGNGGAASNSGGSAGATATGFLKEDFETGTVGKQPAGWDNFIGYVKNSSNPQGDTMAVVDATRAHGGKNSMKFHAANGPAFITRALPANTNKLYVRAWFYMTRQLGANNNPMPNHETLIALHKDQENEVRFGEIKGAIGTNEVHNNDSSYGSDNISPKLDLWGKGPSVPANTWACIEVAFIGDQAQHELHAWADGTEVHSITMGDQWQNGVMPATWLNGKFVDIALGWQSFSNAAPDVWMDDLVLSTSRIGCN